MVHGLRSTVDQVMLVHGPQTGLRWTESTHRLPGVVHALRVHAQVASEGGCSPVFFLRWHSCWRRASLVSLRGEAGAQLGRGKATLGHSDHDPGALVVAGVFQVVGHGGWRLSGARRWQGRARRLSSN